MVGADEKVLELGVGTGKSFPFSPPGAEVTAIDISEKMLKDAKCLLAYQLNLSHER